MKQNIKKALKSTMKILRYPYYRLKMNLNNNPEYIVLGHQKSGTSVIASLLAETGGISKQIDMPGSGICVEGNISLPKYVDMNPQYFSSNLIKEPGLTFIYDKLISLFPNAKYVLVVRHPMDNIRSILDRVKISPNKLPLTFDVIRKMDIHEAWKKKLLGTALSHNEGSNLPETLAYRWKESARVYLDNKADIYLCKYEDFNNNKQEVIGDLASELSIPLNNSIKDKLDVQYQKKGGNRSKNIVELFDRKVIEMVEEYCKEEIKQLGYEFYSK